MHLRTVAAFSALALSACQSVSLNGPVALDGLRPDNGPCDVLAAPNFRAVMAEAKDVTVNGTTVHCPRHEIGLRLKPRMVVWIDTPTWGPALGPDVLKADQSGTDADGNPLPPLEIPVAVGARAPQIASELRLPIRKIGRNGQLTSQEALVLGAFLSLQRREHFGAADDVGAGAQATSDAWRRMFYRPAARAALWNAFVNASSLRRITPNSGTAPEPEHHQPLALVVSPKDFCSYATRPKEGDDPTVSLTPSEGKLLVAGLGFGALDCTTYDEDVEAFAVRTEEFRADPLAGLAAERGKLNNAFFGTEAVSNPATFVSAELAAVSMRSEGAERLWSLAEWEESQVCGTGRTITSFTVRGSLRNVWVAHRLNAAPTATFFVTESVTNDGIERHIVPLGRQPHLQTTIEPEDLSRLRLADVGHLFWNEPWRQRGPDPCRR